MPQAQPELKKVSNKNPHVYSRQPLPPPLSLCPILIARADRYNFPNFTVPRQAALRAAERQPESHWCFARIRCSSSSLPCSPVRLHRLSNLSHLLHLALPWLDTQYTASRPIVPDELTLYTCVCVCVFTGLSEHRARRSRRGEIWGGEGEDRDGGMSIFYQFHSGYIHLPFSPGLPTHLNTLHTEQTNNQQTKPRISLPSSSFSSSSSLVSVRIFPTQLTPPRSLEQTGHKRQFGRHARGTFYTSPMNETW